MIQFDCQCGKKLKVQDSFAGKKAKCPGCGNTIQIPSPAVKEEQESALSNFSLEDDAGPPGKAIAEQPLMAELVSEDEFGLEVQEIPLAPPVNAAPQGKPCPKCGADLAVGAIMCTECGERLDGAPQEPKKAKKKKKKASSESFLSQHGAFIGFVAIVVVLLAGITFGVVVLVKKMKGGGLQAPANVVAAAKAAEEKAAAAKAAREAAAAKEAAEKAAAEKASSSEPQQAAPEPAQAQAQQPPQPARTPSSAPTPPAITKAVWEGFANPFLIGREQVHKVGESFMKFMAETRQAPESLKEIGLADPDAFIYVGSQIAGIDRFRPLLWGAETSSTGQHNVFCSDGTVRPATNETLKAITPVSSEQGFLAPIDRKLMAHLQPQILVTNHRFTSVGVTIDGKNVGSIPQGSSRPFDTIAGNHEVILSVDTHSVTLQGMAGEGVVQSYIVPSYSELPILSFRDFRTAMTRPVPGMTVEKNGVDIAALQGQSLRVEFQDGSGRKAIGTDNRSLAGKVIMADVTLSGTTENPLRINRINRVVEGSALYADGHSATFQQTDIGPIISEVKPNVDAAAGFHLSAPTLRFSFASGVDAPPGQTRLVFADPALKPEPDLNAMSGFLQKTGKPQMDVLLQMTKPRPKAPEPVMPQLTNPDGTPNENIDPAQLQLMIQNMMASQKTPAYGVISTGQVYATIALYGEPTASAELGKLFMQTDAAAEGRGEQLLALARCGQSRSLMQLRTAARDNPTEAAIALAMIDDPTARKALSEVAAKLNPHQIMQAGEMWPSLSGHRSRRAFVEAALTANPALLEDANAINGLMAIDVYALQERIVAQIKNPAPGKFTPIPAPSKAAAAPAEPVQGYDEAGNLLIDRAAPEEEPGSAPVENLPYAPTQMAIPIVSDAAVTDEAHPALRVLAHYSNQEGTAFLMSLLNNPDAWIRRKGLCALAEERDDGCVPPIAAMLSDGDAGVRSAAAAALANIGSKKAVEALTAAMNQELAQAGLMRSVPYLVKRAGPEPVSDMLAKALDAALSVPAPEPGKPPNQTPQVSPINWDSPAGTLMILQAMHLVPRLTDNAAAALERAKNSPNASIKTMASMSATVFATAAPTATQSTGPGNAAAGVKKLLSLPFHMGGASKRKLDANQVDHPLQSADVNENATALRTELAGASADKALPLISQAMDDKSSAVRCAALIAIKNLGPAAKQPEFAELILRGLKDPSKDVVGVALELVADQPDQSFAPAVMDILSRSGQETPGREIMLASARAAGALKLTSALNIITLMLADSDPLTRATGARAMGMMQDADSVLPLTTALQKETVPAVVTAMAWALEQLHTPQAMTSVAELLDRPDIEPPLRQHLLELLVSESSVPGVWQDRIQTGPLLGSANMQALASMAAAAKGKQAEGFIAVARRHLTNPDADPATRASAAQILAKFSSRPDVEKTLLAALWQDAAGIAPAACQMFASNRDPKKIDTLSNVYKSIVEATVNASRAPGIAKASPDELTAMRVALLQGIAGAGGDEAARGLQKVMRMETDPAMAPMFIAAYEKTRSPVALRALGDLAAKPSPFASQAMDAFIRLSPIDKDGAKQYLNRIIQMPGTPPEFSARAADALDNLVGGSGGV